jgi:hypothetical protein
MAGVSEKQTSGGNVRKNHDRTDRRKQRLKQVALTGLHGREWMVFNLFDSRRRYCSEWLLGKLIRDALTWEVMEKWWEQWIQSSHFYIAKISAGNKRKKCCW